MLRHRGARALASEIAELVRGRLPTTQYARWYRVEIAELRATADDVRDDLVVATERDLGRLGAIATPETVREMATYIGDRERFTCLVSPPSGAIENHVCVAYETVSQRGVTVRVPPDGIYLFAGYTHPRARRQGRSRRALAQACLEHARGRSTAWAWVDPSNRAQIRILLGLGFRPMGVDDLRRPLVGARRRTHFAPH